MSADNPRGCPSCFWCILCRMIRNPVGKVTWTFSFVVVLGDRKLTNSIHLYRKSTTTEFHCSCLCSEVMTWLLQYRSKAGAAGRGELFWKALRPRGVLALGLGQAGTVAFPGTGLRGQGGAAEESRCRLVLAPLAASVPGPQSSAGQLECVFVLCRELQGRLNSISLPPLILYSLILECASSAITSAVTMFSSCQSTMSFPTWLTPGSPVLDLPLLPFSQSCKWLYCGSFSSLSWSPDTHILHASGAYWMG